MKERISAFAPSCLLLLLGIFRLTKFADGYTTEKYDSNTRMADTTSSRSPPNYWPRYSGKRVVYTLDGIWNSTHLGSIDHPPTHSDFDSMDPDFDPSQIATPQLVSIPSTVDNTPPGYLGYRGVSFFRTTFSHPSYSSSAAAVARIQFQACSFYCRVWINGHELGDHRAGGYVAWWLDVPEEVLLGGSGGGRGGGDVDEEDTLQQELFVLVDNRFNATTAPLHTGGDFWHYGGILRSVEWHVLPGTTTPNSNSNSNSILWPWRLYVVPQPDLASVHVTLRLTDPTYYGRVSLDAIRLRFDGSPEDHPPSHPPQDNTSMLRPFGGLARNGTIDLGIIPIPNPRIWSTDDPQLHELEIELNGAVVTERFGLRIWDVGYENDGKRNTSRSTPRIRLNGHILQLVGWNHHTQWPGTAASPTNAQLDADIQLLRQGHANFVRGAHYPQDPRWLDRLDEVGMVMWSETLGPSVSVSNLQDPTFLHYQNQQVLEMVDNAMNHASIAFWGFFNEGPSDKIDACPGYRASADAIRSRDTSRFITYASNRYTPHDQCHDVVTVYSSNAYPGWYYPTSHPGDWWDNLAAATVQATGKPFVISETGAAGIYEWTHNASMYNDTLWTLSRQTNVISQDVDHALANPNISGIALWHFFDFKVNDHWENNTHCDYLPNVAPPTCGFIRVNTSIAKGRPGGANHKGSLDFYRRPKPIFSIVASKYQAVTMNRSTNAAAAMVTGVDQGISAERLA